MSYYIITYPFHHVFRGQFSFRPSLHGWLVHLSNIVRPMPRVRPGAKNHYLLAGYNYLPTGATPWINGPPVLPAPQVGAPDGPTVQRGQGACQPRSSNLRSELRPSDGTNASHQAHVYVHAASSTRISQNMEPHTLTGA